MSELPTTWSEVTLADVGQITTGTTPSTKDQSLYGGDTPFVKPGHLDDPIPITHTEQRLSATGVAQSRLLRKGAVMVSCIGNLGKVGVAGVPVVTNQQINSIEFDTSSVDDVYGAFYCRTLKSWMEQEASATTISILNKGRFSAAPFVLAPLAEQRRIADKLEAVLGRVDACRARLDRVPALLKRFRQSVLAAAVAGKLTEEWREAHPGDTAAAPLAEVARGRHEAAGGHKSGNAAAPSEGVHDLSVKMFPAGWEILPLRELVSPDRPVTYGILMPGPELEAGVPYVRVADFPNERLNLQTVRRTSKQMDEQFKRSRLAGGDLLLAIRGTVGRIIFVPPELENANITQDTARLSIQPVVSNTYVLWYLRSSMAQSRMKAATKGVAVRGINIGDVRALQVPLPSRNEQDEIVRRVEALFAFADRIEAGLAEARAQVERLTPAVLAKAFRGELVPQDPNDEPASALLARIRSETNSAVKPKRTKARA